MSYPINQKFNPTYQSSMGLSQAQLQDVDAGKIQQGITQNSALKGVAGGEEKNKWLTPVLTIPVFIAMALGMDKFNDACKGEYNKSLVGRVGTWGEKVGNNKFFQSKPMLWLEKTFNSTNKSFMEKIVPKSKILSAMFHTPSEPTQKMVLMMKNGTISEIATHAASKIEEHFKAGANVTLDGKSLALADIEKLSKETHTKDGIDKLIKICEEQGEKFIDSKKVWKVPGTKGQKYFSDFIPGLGKVFGSKTHFSELANKMKSFNNGNKTWIGKSLPKTMLRLVEGLTNGTAGGKFFIIMGAYFVADAIKKTIDAPKGHGEKRKTFAENFVYNEAMYLTMPLGIKILHAMGGLQYIGLGKEKVATFRNELESFNKKVRSGEIKDEAFYKAEKVRIKGLLKSDIDILKTDKSGTKVAKFFKNLIYKPLKTAANVVMVGLENFAAFNPKGIAKGSGFAERLTQFFTHGKARGVKWAAGGPMRFIFYLFLIAPPLGKLGAKASHLVFGRPTKSVLDEGKEDEKTEAKQPVASNKQAIAQNAGLMAPTKANNSANNFITGQSSPAQGGNLIASYNANAMSTTSTNAPSTHLLSNLTQQKTMTMPQEPVRTYMPSSEGVKVNHDNDKKNQAGIPVPQIDVVMNKADKAEQAARKFASGSKN